jgi:hypothetical protein
VLYFSLSFPPSLPLSLPPPPPPLFLSFSLTLALTNTRAQTHHRHTFFASAPVKKYGCHLRPVIPILKISGLHTHHHLGDTSPSGTAEACESATTTPAEKVLWVPANSRGNICQGSAWFAKTDGNGPLRSHPVVHTPITNACAKLQHGEHPQTSFLLRAKTNTRHCQ